MGNVKVLMNRILVAIWWMYMFFYPCCFPSAGVLCLACFLCHNLIWLSWVFSAGLALVEQFMVFFGLNSSLDKCYLVALVGTACCLAGIICCYCYCIGRVAMVTLHETKVHSTWHLWMCLSVMESLSMLSCSSFLFIIYIFIWLV